MLKKREKLPDLAIIFLIGVAVILIGLYGYNFSDYLISKETSDWGNFGDYLGGVVGTIVSLVAVVLIYFTYNLQRKELEETQKLILTQRNDSYFFELVSLYKDTVNEVKFYKDEINLTGFDALNTLVAELEEETQKFENDNNDVQAIEYFQYVNQKLHKRSNFPQITNVAYSIFEFISSELNRPEERVRFRKTLLTIMRPTEIFLIAVNLPIQLGGSDFEDDFVKYGFVKYILSSSSSDFFAKYLKEYYLDE